MGGKGFGVIRPRGEIRVGGPLIRRGIQGNPLFAGQVSQAETAQQDRVKLGRLCRSLGIDVNVIGPIAEKHSVPLAWVSSILPQSCGFMEFERSKGRVTTLTAAIQSVHSHAGLAKELSEKEKLPLFVAMRVLKLYGNQERWMALYVKPWTKQIYGDLSHRLSMTAVEKIVKFCTEPDEASHTANEVLDRASRSKNRNFDQAAQEILHELGIA